MAEEDKDKASSKLPSEMLTAHLLAMLKDWSGYGYELSKKLEEAGISGYNTGSLYRTLRQMEKNGLITSLWDTSDTGPAKRVYSMTGSGSLFLRNWLKMVSLHKSMLEQFLDTDWLNGGFSGASAKRKKSTDTPTAKETAPGAETASKPLAKSARAKTASNKPAASKPAARRPRAKKPADS